jgi:hypothetical protein
MKFPKKNHDGPDLNWIWADPALAHQCLLQACDALKRPPGRARMPVRISEAKGYLAVDPAMEGGEEATSTPRRRRPKASAVSTLAGHGERMARRRWLHSTL